MVRNGKLYYHSEDADVLLNYSSLEDDLNSLLLRLELPTVKLPTLNVTVGKGHFMGYYDPGDLELIKARFDVASWL